MRYIQLHSSCTFPFQLWFQYMKYLVCVGKGVARETLREGGGIPIFWEQGRSFAGRFRGWRAPEILLVIILFYLIIHHFCQYLYSYIIFYHFSSLFFHIFLSFSSVVGVYRPPEGSIHPPHRATSLCVGECKQYPGQYSSDQPLANQLNCIIIIHHNTSIHTHNFVHILYWNQ